MLDTGTYGAFGDLIASTGSTENSYGFAGEQFDSGLDQYYLRARYYDPTAGRFTRRDDYEGSLGDPITLHKYLYGNSNPVSYIDPSGYISIGEKLQTLTLIGILATLYYVPIISPNSITDRALSLNEALQIEQLVLARSQGLAGVAPTDDTFVNVFVFAELMQYAANQISPTQWVNSKQG